MSVTEVMREVERDLLFYDETGGGVTFSGGEPLRQPDFLLELLQASGERGFHRAVDTHGWVAEDTILRVAEHTDLFLYDLKVMDSDRHLETTGVPNERILSNLERLAERGAAVHIRIPLIPGVNDDDANLDRTAEFVRGLPGIRTVGLLPYHRPAKDKHARFGIPWRMERDDEIPEARVREIAARLARHDLDVSIGD
jgi:pyruvate formate lyase activating enzyme